MARRDWPEAVKAFTFVAQAQDSPGHMKRQAFVGVGRSELARNRTAKAAAALAGANGIDAGASDVLLLAAELAFAERDVDEAARALEKLKRLGPREPAVAALLARIALVRGLGDDAVKAVREALGANPHDAELRAVLAGVYLSFGATEQAFEVTREAARFDPYERPAKDVMMAISDAAVREAKKRLRREAGRSRSVADANAALAHVAYFRGDRSSARAAVDKAKRRDRAHPLASMLDAQLSFEAGSMSRAEAALKRWLGADPQSAVANLMLARVLAQRGRTQEANEALSKAARHDPPLGLVAAERATLELKTDRARALAVIADVAIARPELTRPRRLVFDASGGR
jgi:predicted Zn-dependent protease